MPETKEQYLDDEIATLDRGLVSAQEVSVAGYHRHLWRLGKALELPSGKRVATVTSKWSHVRTDFAQFMQDMANSGFVGDIFAFRVFVYKPVFDYAVYLQSDEWKTKRDAARERAGHHCQTCNADGPILDTHHRTYERIGEELPGDLVVLCRDCHDVFHEHRKLARPR